ncbi:MAG: hypothetical protein GX777_07760 [Fastidiosipila sp.]|nr:hypothetical protein [Fastidiosipila sp.]
MSRNKKSGYIIVAIAFVFFNVIVFAIPTEKTSVFWIAYAFTLVAFVAQIVIWKVAFNKADTLKSKFLGLPLIHVGVVYLILQLIVFIVFMSLPTIANWIAIVGCAIILGLSGIFLISTDLGREEVVRVEEKVQRKVSSLKMLQAEVEMIAEAQSDLEAKRALAVLAEKIRYSDPMSDESLAPIEDEISARIVALKTQPTADTSSSVKQIEILLLERNKKAKLLK